MRLRSLVVAVALLGGLAPAALPGTACAATDERAVLVIDTGSGELRYCVELPEGKTTGIGLIKLASAQHGLQYSLGYGGQAVCRLAGVGPEGDDCFADHPDFWGYWHGDGSGGWSWASSGGGSYKVEPGDVEGWSWGSGQDGSSHQQPPATAFDQVCPALSKPEGKTPDKNTTKDETASSEDESAEEPPAEDATTGSEVGSNRGEQEEKAAVGRKAGHRDKEAGDGGFTAPPAPAPTPVLASEAETPDAPGPSGALMALGVAGLLGAAGFFVRKRSL